MTPSTSRPHADAAPSDWWRHAAVYEVYPRSFADSNGDGEGDIAGVRSRLPYLADLGIDAIWFNPFYPSPLKDGGYDVADYRDIDPLFGTLSEAEAMIHEAHSLGIKVILDIVPNHCSEDHRWFQAALDTPPGSPEWARFHLLAGAGDNGELPPNNWRSVFGGGAWSQTTFKGEPTGHWYLHLFDPSQPDVNWDHPDVSREFEDTLRFWFDRGVDGFRIDVSHGLIKAPGYPDYDESHLKHARDHEGELLDPEPLPHWDQPEVHEVYRAWRRISDEYTPSRVFVGEVWVNTAERLAQYLRPDELHLAFNFSHLQAKWDPKQQRSIIDESLAQNAEVGSPTTWVLENHDVVRAVTRYAGVEGRDSDSNLPTPLPHRNLTDDEIALGTRRARAAILQILALPGSAYIYNGQELGLFEVLDLPDSVRQDPTFFRTEGRVKGRDGCRVPIPWGGSSPSYGFNEGNASWLPQPKQWAFLSVHAQEGIPGSTLEVTRAALHARRAHDAFGDGPMAWRDDIATDMAPTRDDILVFERPGNSGSVFVAMNFGDEPVALPHDAQIIVTSDSRADGHLEGNTCVWFTR
jgi:alpha-glucosidase